MNHDYFITNITVNPQSCNTHVHRKEAHFCSAVIAINVASEKPIFEARWYHRRMSQTWHCCVWVNLPAYRSGVRLNDGLHVSGGGVGSPGYGVDALHLSLTNALEAAGITFTRPDNAFCDVRIEAYCRGIVDALIYDLKIKEFDPVDYVLAHAYG